MATTFIDKARISVKAGAGGNGCVSFHREKYIAAGGPDALGDMIRHSLRVSSPAPKYDRDLVHAERSFAKYVR